LNYLNSDIVAYLFGPLFNLETAQLMLKATARSRELVEEMLDFTAKGEIHLGTQLVCFNDLDTGTFVAVFQEAEPSPSIISFYISSNHRFFGGHTLLCVPFQSCLYNTVLEDKHIVYRHTFKKPKLEEEQFSEIMLDGSDEEKFKAQLFARSRIGYETLPGMSYVGRTSRQWNKRYVEHIEAAMGSTSSTLFHDAIRKMHGQKVLCVHDISGFGMTETAAKEYEKHLIRTSTLAPLGLNMKVG